MNNNKQSSVEWYAEKEHEVARQFVMSNINHREYFDKKRELQEQAKAMHKEEIGNAYEQGDADAYWELKDNEPRIFKNKNEYYNETFGGSNEQK